MTICVHHPTPCRAVALSARENHVASSARGDAALVVTWRFRFGCQTLHDNRTLRAAPGPESVKKRLKKTTDYLPCIITAATAW
jgi:hypothetical protein